MLDDALGGKGVESAVEDPTASCKEGTSRLLDVFFNLLSAQYIGRPQGSQAFSRSGQRELQVSSVDVSGVNWKRR